MHWTNSHEIPNMLSTSQIVIDMFSRAGFSIRSHFQLFCLLMDSWEFRIFKRSHNNFEIRKLLKHLCCAHVHSSNAIFNILKSCVAFFTNFMQHLMQTCCYIKSAILKIHQNCKWNSILLHLPWYYSTVTHTTCLFQAGNDLENSTVHLMKEVCAISSGFIWRSVQKLITPHS